MIPPEQLEAYRYTFQKRAYGQNYRAKQLGLEGSLTPDDLAMLMQEQDGFCKYCGENILGGDWVVEHITPMARGGSSAKENCCLACARCNTAKLDKSPEEWSTYLLSMMSQQYRDGQPLGFRSGMTIWDGKARRVESRRP